jgi:hypothetical protein
MPISLAIAASSVTFFFCKILISKLFGAVVETAVDAFVLGFGIAVNDCVGEAELKKIDAYSNTYSKKRAE